MSEPGGVGNTSVYSGVPAGGSSVIHYDNGLFYKENWETSSAQISGLLWAQYYFWELVNGS